MAHHFAVPFNRLRGIVVAATLLPSLLAIPARGEMPAPKTSSSRSLAVLSPGPAFVETDGASLYANVCQGCHMPDGRGAVGAASYPALAGNPDLDSTPFVLHVVLKGLKGMPAVGRSMSDDQVAAVLNFVRGRFGNTAGEAVTAADAKEVRARPND